MVKLASFFHFQPLKLYILVNLNAISIHSQTERSKSHRVLMSLFCYSRSLNNVCSTQDIFHYGNYTETFLDFIFRM